MTGVTQLPAPVDVAATWDTGAEIGYGQVIGAEQAAKGSHRRPRPDHQHRPRPALGPRVRVGRRGPLPERLSSARPTSAACSRPGVMAQVKHLGVYNQETNRNTPSDNAIVDPRTLQEIYLPAFQASVQQGAASSVMCSYSTINGTYACQNPTCSTPRCASSSASPASSPPTGAPPTPRSRPPTPASTRTCRATTATTARALQQRGQRRPGRQGDAEHDGQRAS